MSSGDVSGHSTQYSSISTSSETVRRVRNSVVSIAHVLDAEAGCSVARSTFSLPWAFAWPVLLICWPYQFGTATSVCAGAVNNSVSPIPARINSEPRL